MKPHTTTHTTAQAGWVLWLGLVAICLLSQRTAAVYYEIEECSAEMQSSGYDLYNDGSTCYGFWGMALSFFEAEYRANGVPCGLLEIRTQEDFDTFLNVAYKHNYLYTSWLGAMRNRTQSEFHWLSDNAPVEMPYSEFLKSFDEYDYQREEHCLYIRLIDFTVNEDYDPQVGTGRLVTPVWRIFIAECGEEYRHICTEELTPDNNDEQTTQAP